VTFFCISDTLVPTTYLVDTTLSNSSDSDQTVQAVRLLILWGSLRSSGAIMRLVGKGGIEAISRLMGFLLVCMGVQFIINGILEIIKTYH
ncbi:MarC family protein, partial [Escherichia coli]